MPSLSLFTVAFDIMERDVKDMQVDSLTGSTTGVTGSLQSCSTLWTPGFSWWSRLVQVWTERHGISQDSLTLDTVGRLLLLTFGNLLLLSVDNNGFTSCIGKLLIIDWFTFLLLFLLFIYSFILTDFCIFVVFCHKLTLFKLSRRRHNFPAIILLFFHLTHSFSWQ